MSSGTRRRTVKCNKARKACRTKEYNCPHAKIHKEHYAREDGAGVGCTKDGWCEVASIEVRCKRPAVKDFVQELLGK